MFLQNKILILIILTYQEHKGLKCILHSECLHQKTERKIIKSCDSSRYNFANETMYFLFSVYSDDFAERLNTRMNLTKPVKNIYDIFYDKIIRKGIISKK